MTIKDIIKITLNLIIIYLIGGAILAAVYANTSPVIYKKAEQEKQDALQKMMPQADKIYSPPDASWVWAPHGKHGEYYEAQKGGQTIGYIVRSFGKGYSGYIDTLVSVDKNFTIVAIDVLHHTETPGLGDEIDFDYFKDQFKGKTLDHLVVRKEETKEDIQAITGATISSRAVSEDAVKHGIETLKQKFSSGDKQ
jgi:electron transport complex protein RnfG